MWEICGCCPFRRDDGGDSMPLDCKGWGSGSSRTNLAARRWGDSMPFDFINFLLLLKIGVIVMVRGDDKGVVPIIKVPTLNIVVLPITCKGSDTKVIFDACVEFAIELWGTEFCGFTSVAFRGQILMLKRLEMRKLSLVRKLQKSL